MSRIKPKIIFFKRIYLNKKNCCNVESNVCILEVAPEPQTASLVVFLCLVTQRVPSELHAGVSVFALAHYQQPPFPSLCVVSPLNRCSFPHNLLKGVMQTTTLGLWATRERISLLLKAILKYNLTTLSIRGIFWIQCLTSSRKVDFNLNFLLTFFSSSKLSWKSSSSDSVWLYSQHFDFFSGFLSFFLTCMMK